NEVSRIHAVNHDKDLLIAVDVNHEDRFQLDELEKNLRKKVEKQFKNLNVTLSTDQKLLIEVEKLEHKLENGEISEKKLTKKMKKKLNPQAQQYQALQKRNEKKRPIIRNCVKAFFVGGFICFIGQLITTFYIHFFDFTEQTAGNPTVATLVIITMFLTGFGIYDHIVQFAGAGTAVPVTVFVNAVISSTIEHRTEGYILGVGTNMLKLSGPVIVYGVFSSFVIALIKTIFTQFIGG